MRLDSWLVYLYPEFSRSYFQDLIENGLVKVNGNIAKKSIPVCSFDKIKVEFSSRKEMDVSPESIPLDILYEDDHIVVVNKSASMVVHPSPGHPSGTFVNALLNHCYVETEHEKDIRPGIVHRLDKETTGVLLAAKTMKAHSAFIALFSNRSVFKQYIALIRGRLQSKTVCVSLPVGRDPKDRKKMSCGLHLPRSREAYTEFSEIVHNKSHSLIFAHPKTGRQHQIRVHLRHLGLFLVGEKMYCRQIGNNRHMLHAHKMGLNYPLTGKYIEFTASLHNDFKSCISACGLGYSNDESFT